MKIVYCIAGTFNAGGMERVLANKANYLASAGHEVFIVTTDQNGREPYFPLNPSIVQQDLGINYRFSGGLFFKSLYYPFKQMKHKRRLKKVLALLKPDITVSMFDHDAAFLHKMKEGGKKVLEVHFSRFKRLQYGRTGLWGAIDRYRSSQDLFVAAHYHRFVVLTEEDKRYWGTLPNIQVIPNANTFFPEHGAELTNKRVIAVGRFDGQKAFDELIMAWKLVQEQHPGWSLDIFGEGPLKAELQALIEQQGLQKVLHLHAPVQDIEAEYLKRSMLVMTSKYEGFPMALLEAQACGLPLLAYACKCGPADIIQDGKNGYLLAEGDRTNLARKINFLIEHSLSRKQMGINARTCAAKYSEAAIMQQWLELFEQLTWQGRRS